MAIFIIFLGIKHLLIGINPEDLDQLNKFMIANGITENAANSATSPLLTAETSLTTEDGSLGCDNIRFVEAFKIFVVNKHTLKSVNF